MTLSEIEHYKKYPAMIPFVGENYYKAKRKILIVAESHYLEGPSDYNTGPTKWYSSTQENLFHSEVKCINTSEIVKESDHMVFRELENILNKSIEMYNGRSINSIAYMNGFQRPSQTPGAPISLMASLKDFEEASKTIEKVIEILKPQLVIFISKYTWDKVGKMISKGNLNIGTIFNYVSHPASGGRYWNNKNYVNSKFKLIELLK